MASLFRTHGEASLNIPHTEQVLFNTADVGKSLDKQFGRFLRQQRGEASYHTFAKKLGVSASTLYRLENAEQSVTLGKLEDVLKRLKAGVRDVFQ